MLENLVLMKHQMYTRKPGFNETSNVHQKNVSNVLVLMKPNGKPGLMKHQMYTRKPGFNETLKCILENLVLMKHQMYTRKPGFNETSNVYSKTWF